MLATYLPRDRLLSINRQSNLPNHCSGAALFSDLSGFTPLTERLARELGEKAGAEALLHLLNEVFDGIIHAVHRHGGSVIGFAGDAITCWFDSGQSNPNADLTSIVKQATACGFAIQVFMQPYMVDPTKKLTVKVAIAAGTARRFVVGDANIHFVDVLAGQTLQYMAMAEHLASQGEVVLHKTAAQLIAANLEIGEWRRDAESQQMFAHVSGHHISNINLYDDTPTEANDKARLAQWVQPAVLRRLNQAGEGLLAEFRPCCMLFLRFEGIDYDGDEAAGTKLNAYICWVQQVISRYGGTLIQLTVGDKGSYLYVAYGAPNAHEDDALRATLTALELRAPPANFNYIGLPHIGLSRGRAYAGAYGASSRKTYGVLGDETNLAARLMSYAQAGQVVMSERIAQGVTRSVASTSVQFYIRLLGAIRVKGKANLLNIFEPIIGTPPEIAETLSPSTQLIGRDAELRRLDGWLNDCLIGNGVLGHVTAESGMGKSALLKALITQAQRRGIRTVISAGQRFGEQADYEAWRGVFIVLLNLAPAELLPDQLLAVLQTRLLPTQPQWQMRLPLLGDVFGVALPDNDFTLGMEPRVRQQAVCGLLIEILQVFAPPALLVVIDDAQYLDELSQAFLSTLANVIPSLPIVLSIGYRTQSAQQNASDTLGKLPNSRIILLTALLPDAARALVNGQFDGKAVSELIDTVTSHAHGNPFFIVELVDSLHNSRAVQKNAAGDWEIDVYASLELPESMQGMILARVDHLPENQKPTLKTASVIGNKFERTVLAQTHPAKLGLKDIIQHLDELRKREFLSSSAQAGVFMFRDVLTHEGVYDALLSHQQRDLHRNVGQALEKLQPEAIERLAYHTYLGEDWNRALRYQTSAGRRSQALFANRRAIDHFTKALICIDRTPEEEPIAEVLELKLRLGELLVTVGDHEHASDILNEARKVADSIGDAESYASACRWLARSYEVRSDYDTALKWIDDGLLMVQDELSIERAELLMQAGLIDNRQGRPAQSLRRCLQALHIAELLDATVVQAKAQNLRGQIKMTAGKFAKALEHFEIALALYEDAKHVSGQALIHNQIGRFYLETGQLAAGAEPFQQAQRLFNDMGDLYRRGFVENNLGEIARKQGEWQTALQYYETSLRSISLSGGSAFAIAVLHNNIGSVYTQLGQLDLARQHLNKALVLCEQAKSRSWLPEIYRHLAEAALQDNLALAQQHANHALTLSRELGQKGEEGSIYRVLGQIALHTDRAQAFNLISESIRIQQSLDNQYELGLSQAVLAMM